MNEPVPLSSLAPPEVVNGFVDCSLCGDRLATMVDVPLAEWDQAGMIQQCNDHFLARHPESEDAIRLREEMAT